MKSSTLLDFAVFQLTPTRTRCDLVISANGKTEKIASGLLNPFLSHLKTAQDEMAKGGYSIILKPEPNTDASWFAKGTVERFVRFVSTPEVLERVHTLESEILQIEEAIAIQSTCDGGTRCSAEDSKGKLAESIEDNKLLHDSTEEKAIVLYKPDAPLPKMNGSESQEGNSKVQLLRVLETRRSALQKEQGMTFARAIAAGFEVDNMSALIAFAGCFKASRLMDACTSFTELWKRKHESGQWLEIEATEAMSNQSEFFANTSGIVLSDSANKQKEPWPGSHNDIASESKSKTSPVGTDNRTPNQVPLGNHEYMQGQYPNHMFPPWTMHPPPGALPIFQPYGMQGIPYYQNYQGSNPYFQHAYPSFEDPRLNTDHKVRGRKHSSDIVDNNVALEMSDPDEETDEEMNPSQRKKATRSSKKLPGTVVIRNINYIAPKKQNSSDSEPHPTSGSERDGEDGIAKGDTPDMGKNSMKSSQRNGNMRNSSHNEEIVHGDEIDGGQWQAFQSYLLRDNDEDRSAADQGMFSMEKELRVKRRQNVRSDDPLALDGNRLNEFEGSTTDMHKMSGNFIIRARALGDDLFSCKDQHSDGRNYLDVHTIELGGRQEYRRTDADDFMIHKDENLSAVSPSDILAEDKHRGTNANARSPHNREDDSYVVSLRSTSTDGLGCADRKAIDIDSEIPSTDWKRDDLSKRTRINYEPDDMTLMPERNTDRASTAYDIAFDYDMQVQRKEGSVDDKNGQSKIPNLKQGSKKPVKDQKLSWDVVDRKKNVGPIKRGKPSKLSPLDEARARAERLRSYKADLQKLKKEKEEEQIKRLEALKLERQKRIAARSSSIPAQLLQPSQRGRKQVPTKLSPGSNKGSKFSDVEPGSSSPLQRCAVRKPLVRSRESYKTPKTSGPIAASTPGKNRLSRSVSSLPEQKQSSNLTPETKASMARLRRLSEPKSISGHHALLTKAQNSDSTKSKVTNGTDSKKISAIMNLDRSKAATLPELKIRPSKSSDDFKNKSVSKESTDKMSGGKLAASKGVELENYDNQVSQPSDGGNPHAEKSGVCKRIDFQNHHDQSSEQSEGDDNLIVEKTVVVLQTKKPRVKRDQRTDEMIDKSKTLPNHTIVHEPDTGGVLSGFDQKVLIAEKQIGTHELTSHNAKASLKYSNTSSVEKPYQAPYARVSSLEYPCNAKSEYGKALLTGLDTNTTASENVDGCPGSDPKNPKVEKMLEAGEKHLQETPKGIRRLLKFGRKSNGSGTSERISESDNISVGGSEADDQAAIPASSEVNTLKSLISQDETPTAISNPKKSSRHFSLLSPFRSKNSEKKLTT